MHIRMEQRDFRGLGRDTQEALRARAVYLESLHDFVQIV